MENLSISGHYYLLEVDITRISTHKLVGLYHCFCICKICPWNVQNIMVIILSRASRHTLFWNLCL